MDDRSQRDFPGQPGHGAGDTHSFARKAPLFWPIALSVLVGALVAGGLLLHLPMLVPVALLLLLPAAIAWLVSARTRGVFLEVSITGIRAAGHEIPWRNVANIRVTHEDRGGIASLAVDLNEPLPPRGLTERVNSVLSRGRSDREVSFSLRYAVDSAETIRGIADQYWSRIVGEDIPFAALGKQIAQYQHEQRKFSQRPAAEKRRMIIGISVPFLIIGWCWQGIAASFWSSPAWSRVSWWVAACVTALGLFALLRKSGLASVRNQRGTAGYLIMSLFVFALLTGFSWLIVGRSLADIATRLIGTPREFTATLRKDFKAGAASCQHRITGELIEQRFPSAYCPDSEEYARLPNAGPMRVVTRDSWFGLHIDRIEPLNGPPE